MNLFAKENEIKIIELNSKDAFQLTDNYKIAFELIKKHEQNYPDIEKWFRTKVITGLKNNERAVYIGLNNDIPIASAIVKKGEHAKFCHLHIEEDLRHQNLGEIFFILMASCTKKYAKDVHFSLPEGLWEEKQEFFKSFGFENVKKYNTQYRTFEQELTASTQFDLLWSRIIDKIPSMVQKFEYPIFSPLNGVVMSIQPKYSEKILSGEKNVEIRKKFNRKWKNHKVSIYSSSPEKKLIGHATISDVTEDHPEKLWERFSDNIGCAKSQYDNYTQGLNKAYAITLTNVFRYSTPVTLNCIANAFEKRIIPPQSYCSVSNNKDWKSLVSLAEIMQGGLNVITQHYL